MEAQWQGEIGVDHKMQGEARGPWALAGAE